MERRQCRSRRLLYFQDTLSEHGSDLCILGTPFQGVLKIDRETHARVH